MADLIQKIVETIEPSISYDKLFPASAILKNGKIVDCVYFVNNPRLKGSYPMINIEDIADIKESPYRLPAKFANEIYERGETSMCCIQFYIVVGDHKAFSYRSGGYVDFIDLPEGYKMKDIFQVNQRFSFTKFDTKERRVKDFTWCLVDDDRLK